MHRETVGALLLYFFFPVVYFNAIVTSRITASTLSLPLLFLVLCSGMCFLFLAIGARVWQDSTKNILAQTAGTGNYAYFAIPAAAAILPSQSGALVVLSGVGFIAYENTLGFFIAARGNHSVADALAKLAKLPALYAVAVALLINYLHVDVGSTILDAAGNFKGGFSVLGMMTIGLGLAGIDFGQFRLDWTYVLLAFAARFVVWPLLMVAIVAIDSRCVGFYSAQAHKVMILMAVIPLSANTIIYAIALGTEPEKVSVGVLLSTLVALVLIPLVGVLYLQ
jgi:hypothetical protein